MNKPILIITMISVTLILLTPTFQSQTFKKDAIPLFLENVQVNWVDGRIFVYIQPESTPQAQGYPVIFLLHGASQHWFSWLFGFNRWSQTQQSFTSQAIHENYAVILTESNRPISFGPRAWDVFEKNATRNKDIQYLQDIITWLNTSKSDLTDTNNMFCTGFSSGAFMCSRLALSAEHMFHGLALNSGCNAESITLTKKGPIFNFTLSQNLSEHHPPTLLLHGKQDKLVPVEGSTTYYNDLKNASIQTNLLINPEKGHIWLSDYNHKIIAWFNNQIT